MSSLKSKAARLLCQPRENAPSLSIKPELSVRDPPTPRGGWYLARPPPCPPLPLTLHLAARLIARAQSQAEKSSGLSIIFVLSTSVSRG